MLKNNLKTTNYTHYTLFCPKVHIFWCKNACAYNYERVYMSIKLLGVAYMYEYTREYDSIWMGVCEYR